MASILVFLACRATSGSSSPSSSSSSSSSSAPTSSTSGASLTSVLASGASLTSVSGCLVDLLLLDIVVAGGSIGASPWASCCLAGFFWIRRATRSTTGTNIMFGMLVGNPCSPGKVAMAKQSGPAVMLATMRSPSG
eukprot:8971384-Heterocapsa_arctica.AAC.1